MSFLLLCLSLAVAQTPPELYQQSYDQEAVGNFVGAMASVDALPSSEQQTYTWALRKAWLAYLAGRFDVSIGAYDQAIRRAPKAVEPLLGKMLPLLATRRWADARAVGGQVLAMDPESFLGRSRSAWASYNLGRYADAEQLYRGVLADYPGDVEMRAGLGWTLLKQGKAGAARKEFEAVLHVAPKHPSALSGLAACR